MKQVIMGLGVLICTVGCHTGNGDSYYEDQEHFRFDAGAQDAPEAVPELPLFVDEWFGPSGYMGDGEDGLVESSPCPARPSTGQGTCHRFTWTPGDQGWAGVFWQFPDGNWGTAGGLSIPNGARTVRFTAWGDTGTEVVSFGVGMGDVDGFSAELDAVSLTDTPTEYVIDLSEVNYGDVVGGFVWTCDQMGAELVFYIDEIRWDTQPFTEQELE